MRTDVYLFALLVQSVTRAQKLVINCHSVAGVAAKLASDADRKTRLQEIARLVLRVLRTDEAEAREQLRALKPP